MTCDDELDVLARICAKLDAHKQNFFHVSRLSGLRFEKTMFALVSTLYFGLCGCVVVIIPSYLICLDIHSKNVRDGQLRVFNMNVE